MDEFLLQVLACPRCEFRPPVREEDGFLVCTECGYGYRIIDGIPQMLVEDAVAPDELREELKKSDA